MFFSITTGFVLTDNELRCATHFHYFAEHFFLIFMKFANQHSVAQQSFNPLTTNVPYHKKTSQLICIANQLTGFHIDYTLVIN